MVCNCGTSTDTLSVNILDGVFIERTHTYLLDTYLGVELLEIRTYMSSTLVNTAKEFF